MTATVDARGMRCPWPVLRLARVIRETRPAAIAMLADDARAPAEIAAFAAQGGWALIETEMDDYRRFDLTLVTHP